LLAASVTVTRDATGSNGDHDLNTLSLAEARIFADNVALGASVTQSSSHGAGPAANATDGNLGNFTHTLSSDDSPTLTIDLGGEFQLDSVVLHNRGDGCCGFRMADITLELLDGVGGVRYNSGTLNASNILGSPDFIGIDLHDLAGGAVSGVFQIRLTRDISGVSGGNDVMSFGEVQAYGVVAPEPTTLLIWSLLAGLGVGLGWRRRKSSGFRRAHRAPSASCRRGSSFLERASRQPFDHDASCHSPGGW
jgi:hypothetical protein